MGYRGGFGGRGRWFGPWPGRGPFSFLPPWQRPGWLFGRGRCRWLFDPRMLGAYGHPGFPGYPSYGFGGLFGHPYMPHMGTAFPPYWGYAGTIPPYRYPY